MDEAGLIFLRRLWLSLETDVGVEEGLALIAPADPKGADGEAFAEPDPLNRTPRKLPKCSQGRPYRKPTQVGE